jgi:hypothetical protein
MHHHSLARRAALLIALVPAVALAQDPVPPPAPEPAAPVSTPAAETSVAPPLEKSGDQLLYERGGLVGIGLVPTIKLGGSFSGVFTELGTSPDVELEVGYLLPPLERSIEVFLGFVYTQPTTERKDVVDTSGPNGTSRLEAPMHYDLTQQMFTVTAGALYRLKLPVPMFRPYAALGARLYLMKTKVDGSDGVDAFGENREGATSAGFYGALGGEVHFGPGAALLEAQVTYAGIDGFVMRDTNAGALNLALGYRLFL